ERTPAPLGRHTNTVSALAFSPDGTRLASGSGDQTVRLWDLLSGKEPTTLRKHTNGVDSLAFSPDGLLLASGSTDGTAVVWETFRDQDSDALEGRLAKVASLAFTPDGRMLVTGGGMGGLPELRRWDTATGKLRGTLQEHPDSITAVSISPDGKTLA